jgi:hypothetical protein
MIDISTKATEIKKMELVWSHRQTGTPVIITIRERNWF